ncbi:MAG: ABC transporter ATP-binding protein [Rhodobacteraceae bacterium]|nr:ABC transporter ATP-binding protein [Paracoccaceae bacterium]
MFRYFESLVDPYAAYDEPDAPPRRLWSFLRAYSRPFLRIFALAALLSVLVAAVELGLIFYMGRVVDLLATASPATVWDAHGVELLAIAGFILILRPVLQALDVLVLNNAILPNYGTLFRWRAHRHVLRQSVGWFENDFAGRIANRIMQAPPAAGEAVFQIFDALTFSIAYLVGAAFLLAEADLRLALPLLVWFALYGLLVVWTVRRVGPASKASSDARSMTTGRVVDAYANIQSVKLFAHHDREIDYAREAIEETRRTFAYEMRIFTLMDIALVVLNGALIVGVVGWAVALWSQGNASVGVVAAATALTLRLNAMTGWIMWAVSTFFRSLGVVAEGMETIAQPITLRDAPDAAPLRLTAGRIEAVDLTHHYGREAGGLDHIGFVVQPGEKIGLVGRSGVGKSTVVKLLLRFYDAEGGRIEIDGQDIARVTQDSLRAQIGMVQQDSSLLHRSVRDNILYGRPDAPEADMIAAARRAEAHDFIQDLIDPDGRRGYDAHVGERGVKLSGGQRQRIALARVMLKDAPILVLDEATSALDSEVEAAIQETLYGMMAGKTVIAIAHRLSTIARMDRILVLEKGRIAEEGSHQELLDRGGLYAGFWARQSGGFLGTGAPSGAEAAE